MADRILRRAEVLAITGLSHSTVWRLEKAGQFPRRRQISAGTVGWIASEVEEWLKSRPAVVGGEEDGEERAA